MVECCYGFDDLIDDYALCDDLCTISVCTCHDAIVHICPALWTPFQLICTVFCRLTAVGPSMVVPFQHEGSRALYSFPGEDERSYRRARIEFGHVPGLIRDIW